MKNQLYLMPKYSFVALGLILCAPSARSQVVPAPLPNGEIVTYSPTAYRTVLAPEPAGTAMIIAADPKGQTSVAVPLPPNGQMPKSPSVITPSGVQKTDYKPSAIKYYGAVYSNLNWSTWNNNGAVATGIATNHGKPPISGTLILEDPSPTSYAASGYVSDKVAKEDKGNWLFTSLKFVPFNQPMKRDPKTGVLSFDVDNHQEVLIIPVIPTPSAP